MDEWQVSEFTRNVEKDKELFKLPITIGKLAGILEAFPEYVSRICELEEENATLQKQVDKANRDIALLEEEKDLEDRCRSFGD